MKLFLENWLGLASLELGLEVFEAWRVGATVGAAASVVQVEAFILNLFTIDTPAFALVLMPT